MDDVHCAESLDDTKKMSRDVHCGESLDGTKKILRNTFYCDNPNHSTTVDNYLVRNHSKIVGKRTNLLINSSNVEYSLEGDRTLDDTKKMESNCDYQSFRFQK